jgi:hypothetical protein
VELVSLLDCTNERVTYAFLDMVLNKFGALAKVFIDQGIKFYEEFQELCEKAFDRHITSWDHPKVDGLVKWMVQMVKLSLRKYGLHKGHTWKWDL